MILAIIPCRSGSKGIPDKNIKYFLDKPLFIHTALKAQNCHLIDFIFFSTDSQYYLNLFNSLNLSKNITNNYIRPDFLSNDNASTSDVILDVLKKIKNVKDIILLQATTPLVPSSYITKMIKEYLDKEVFSLICANEPIDNPYDCFYQDKNITYRIGTSFNCGNRQNHHYPIKINGSAYIISKKNFIKYKTFFNERTQFFMIPKIYSIDIDEEQNFKIAEILGKYLLDDKK